MIFTLNYLIKRNFSKRTRAAALRSLNADAKWANGVFYAETRQGLRAEWLALKPADRKKLIAKEIG